MNFGANSLLGWTAIVPLVAFYCWICISVKRFHDMGKSGWLAVIPIGASLIALFAVVPIFVAAIIGAAASNNDSTAAAAMLSAIGGSFLILMAACLVSLGFLIWQGVAPSDLGENRYGPAPQPALA